MTFDTAALLPIKVLHDFAQRIESLNIQYMLTGSMAMFQYSNYRMTADIDVVLELLPEHADLIIKNFEPDYYIPHNSMRRAIESKRMFNMLNQETSFKVDCVMLKPTPFHQNAFERRSRVDFHGREISVITAEDLIVSKLWWASDSKSEKQMTDVRNLLRNQLDLDYIKGWTGKLGVDDLFDQCTRQFEDE